MNGTISLFKEWISHLVDWWTRPDKWCNDGLNGLELTRILSRSGIYCCVSMVLYDWVLLSY